MRTVLLAFALFGAACGGNNPSGPTEDEVRCIIRSARDGTPIAGATVAVLGVGVFVSDGEGFVPLEPRFAGAPVEITPPLGMERFLAPRKFVFRTASLAADTMLWPSDSGLTEGQTFAVIYGNSTGNRLIRPSQNQVCILAGTEVFADARAASALPLSIETLNAADSDIVWNRCELALVSALNVNVRLDPGSEVFQRPENRRAGAYAALFVDGTGGIIERAEVVFRCFDCFMGDHLLRAFTHELVHVRGLRDTNATHGGMMGSPEPVRDFAPWEKEAMRYAYLRQQGTRWPDNSISASQPSARGYAEQNVIYIVD